MGFDLYHDKLVTVYQAATTERKKGPNTRTWWNEDCQDAKKFLEENRDNIDVVHQARRNMHRAIRQARRKHFDNIIWWLGESRKP
jgi:hypothetical protein